jgi:hypothetical protein
MRDQTYLCLFAWPILLLVGCATQPPGHHHFTLGEGTAPPMEHWSLEGLAREGVLDMRAHFGAESTPRQVARLALAWGSPAPNAPGALTLRASDPGCAGAYGFALSRAAHDDSVTTDYLDRKLPWGAPLHMRVAWSGRDAQVTIDGIGERRVELSSAIDRMSVDVSSGTLIVDDLVYTDHAAH